MWQRQNSINSRELLKAASEGDEKKVKILLRQKVDINFVDRDGNTALMYAIKSGRSNVVSLLLQQENIDLTVEDGESRNCFDLARNQGNEIVNLLVNKTIQLAEKLIEDTKDKVSKRERPPSDPEDEFQEDDIDNVLKLELSYMQYESNKNNDGKSKSKFQLVREDELAVRLYDLRSRLSNDDLMLIVKSTKHNSPFWAALAIFTQGQQKRACFFDSTGGKLREDFAANIKLQGILFEEMELDQNERDYDNSAVYAIECLKIINDKRKKGSADLGIEPPPKNLDMKSFKAISTYMKTIQDKIAGCKRLFLESPDKVNEGEETGYRMANAFICFIETFAFRGEGDEQTRKKIVNYFTDFDDSEITLMNQVREFLFKRPAFRIDLDEVLQLFNSTIKTWTFFFFSLSSYITLKIADRSNPPNSEDKKGTNLSSVLKPLTQKEYGSLPKVHDSFLQDEFEKLIKAAYKNKVSEKLRFHFLVNFCPYFDKTIKERGDLKELRKLRNYLIHQFYAYDTQDFEKQIVSLKQYMVKYSFAQNVSSLLKQTRLSDSPEIIDKRLREGLENYKKRFQDFYFAAADDDDSSFAATKSEVVFSRKRDHEIEESVRDYLRFVIVTEPIGGDSLSDFQRRRLLENFQDLNRSKEDKKNSLSKLWKLGVSLDNFTEVFKKIVDIIKSLRGIQSETGLKLNDLILSYDSYATQKRLPVNFESTRCDAAKIRENLARLPPEKLLYIKVGDVDREIPVVKTVVNILNTFLNTYRKSQLGPTRLEMAFHDYKFLDFLVQNDLEWDETSGKKIYKKSYKSGEKGRTGDVKPTQRADSAADQQLADVKDLPGRIQVHIRIKKLLNLKYAAPYIAQLIYSVEDDQVVEREDYRKLIEILLTQQELVCMNHLCRLLDKNNDDLNLYEIVCKKLMEDNTILGKMKIVFSTPEHVEKILQILKEKIKTKPSIAIKILKLVNQIALELTEKWQEDKALSILKSVQNHIVDLVEKNEFSVVETKLIWAKVKMNHMRYCERNREGVDETNDTLVSLINDQQINGDQYLSALRLMARLQAHRGNWAKSYEQYKFFCEEVIKHVLQGPIVKIDEEFQPLTQNFLRNLIAKDKYKKLLASSEENDILRNICDMAFMKMKASPKIEICERGQRINYLVLNISKPVNGDTHKLTKESRKFVINTSRILGEILWSETTRHHDTQRQRADLLHYYCTELLHNVIYYKNIKEEFGPYSSQTINQHHYLAGAILKTDQLCKMLEIRTGY